MFMAEGNSVLGEAWNSDGLSSGRDLQTIICYPIMNIWHYCCLIPLDFLLFLERNIWGHGSF
jgi:hypothetical protein